MNVHGVMIIDGKEHRIDARNVKLQLEYESPTTQATRNPQMGTQVSESFSISGGTLVTSTTIKSGDKTTTTTTTSDDSGSTTTTTTTDGNGSTTDIKITRK
jgi:hypothetical protein